jgi:hypothetical protein
MPVLLREIAMLLPKPANDTQEEIFKAAEAFALAIVSSYQEHEDPMERVVECMRSWGDQRPVGFWTAAIREVAKYT